MRHCNCTTMFGGNRKKKQKTYFDKCNLRFFLKKKKRRRLGFLKEFFYEPFSLYLTKSYGSR